MGGPKVLSLTISFLFSNNEYGKRTCGRNYVAACSSSLRLRRLPFLRLYPEISTRPDCQHFVEDSFSDLPANTNIQELLINSNSGLAEMIINKYK